MTGREGIVSLGGSDEYTEVKVKRDQSGVWIHQGTDTVLIREKQWAMLVDLFLPYPDSGDVK